MATTVINDFYCTNCGKKGICIPRKVGKERTSGHLKKLYCIYCKGDYNHAEIKQFSNYTYEDFKLEFDLGRFVNGDRRPVADLPTCPNKECKFNVNGKCWNDNHSEKCERRANE